MYDNLNQATSDFKGKAKKLACGSSAWIFKAERVAGQPLLTKLDAIVANIPDAERTKLKKRFSDIIPDNAARYVREFDDQFLEALVEILGWGWLKERYPQHTPCFTMGTPDLVVKDNSDQEIAAMECKKIRSSNEDRDYYKNKHGTVQKVKTSLSSPDYDKNPFLRKLIYTLSEAEGQVKQSGAPDKFIFLDISFDTPLMFDYPTIPSIKLLADKLYKKGICLYSFEQYKVEKPITGI